MNETQRNLPPLNALKSFEAAARHESFRDAGQELFVSHSAISHQIKELEAALGTSLFERRGRGVVLNEAGSMLFPVVRDALDRIQEGVDLVKNTRFQSELHLQMYVTFAVRWLIPRLHRFTDANPDLLVRLTTSRLSWDFDEHQADLGVIYNAGDKPSKTGTIEFRRAKLFPVCSPRYLENHPDLMNPTDLANHVWLQVYTTGNDDWTAWLEAQNISELTGRDGLQFDSYLLAYEAAIEGQGIAMAVDFLVEPDLRAGTLHRLFVDEADQPGCWQIVRNNRRLNSSAIERFNRWLLQETHN